jgi:thymidylate synthase (FAD)
VSLTPSAEEVIVFCARVSNPSNQTKMDTADKLIKYLITHKHWSPFELAHMTVQIKTSRAIAAQILRHRSFTFQEFSQRYALASNNVFHEARRQDTKNRQNSIDDMPQSDKDWFLEAQNQVWDLAKEKYDEALAKGVAKEQARFLLPLSTETTMYMSGSIRSWIHYIDLRTANGTQKEHMEVAQACKDILVEQLPLIAKALDY